MKIVKLAVLASILIGSITVASSADARHWRHHHHRMCGWHHHHRHCW